METFGFENARKAFSKLPDRVEKKVLRGAMNSAGTPVVNAIRSLVPEEFGFLRSDIGKRVTMHKNNDIAVASIGVRTRKHGVSKSQRWTKTGVAQPSKYAHILEFGTKDGRILPKLFLTQGFAHGVARAKRNFSRTLARGIKRETDLLKRSLNFTRVNSL